MELEVLGLSSHEERAYVALVDRPHATASQLAEDLGTTTAAAARLLAALVARRLAMRSAGRPPQFVAEPPDISLAALVQEREEVLLEARRRVQQLAEAHRESHRLENPDLPLELISDGENIARIAHRLLTEARHQVRGFDLPPYVERPGSVGRQRVRRASGVITRTIYTPEALAVPGRYAGDILPGILAGERARLRPSLPLKLIIRDRHDALIPFSLARGGIQIAYIVRRSPVLSALEGLFEAEWERASAIDPTAPDGVPAEVASGAADEETRALLTLLATGMTDAAIARAQGWSERTTQRRISGLMTSLGAATRFQAAAEASRRGWL